MTSTDGSPSVAAGRDDVQMSDLHELLTTFYDTIEREPLLAPYFAALDMRAHMPRIVAFWETIVFGAHTYKDNAFLPHATMPGLTTEHFTRWLATLDATIDARFAGPNAERMKDLGHRVAYSMQLRLGISPAESFRPTVVPVAAPPQRGPAKD